MELHKTSLRHASKRMFGRVLTPTSQFRIVTGRKFIWLCDNSSVKGFLVGSTLSNPKLRRWFVILSKFPLKMVHLPGANKWTNWLVISNWFWLKNCSQIRRWITRSLFSHVYPTRFVDKTFFQAQWPITFPNGFYRIQPWRWTNQGDNRSVIPL